MEKIKQYQGVSADVWAFFRKYFPEGADTSTSADDIHALDEKYKGTEVYKFMQDLLKVFFLELVEVKG